MELARPPGCGSVAGTSLRPSHHACWAGPVGIHQQPQQGAFLEVLGAALLGESGVSDPSARFACPRVWGSRDVWWGGLSIASKYSVLIGKLRCRKCSRRRDSWLHSQF